MAGSRMKAEELILTPRRGRLHGGDWFQIEGKRITVSSYNGGWKLVESRGAKHFEMMLSGEGRGWLGSKLLESEKNSWHW